MNHITGNTYTTTIGDAEIGLYITGRRVVLIDTGRNTGNGESESLLSLLRKFSLTPAAIINTHLHIDHIGTNRLLQEAFGCPAYCSASEITAARDDAGSVHPNPSDSPFRIVPLPGHSIAHQAVVTPDNVCFLGDAVMSRNSKLPYHLDMAKAIASMQQILKLPYPCYVLSHAGAYDKTEIRRIAEDNLLREQELQARILMLLDGGRIKTEKLAALFMDSIGISREKQDIFWVTDTAMERIRQLQRQDRIELRSGYACPLW